MHFLVREEDTAIALGSGDVPVLGTPRLVAWLEAATVRAAEPFIREGETSVGVAVRIEHRRASRVGDAVEITAVPDPVARGRRLTFRVRAMDADGAVVAEGEIDRMVVDRVRFLGS